MLKSRRMWPVPYEDDEAQEQRYRVLLVEDERVDPVMSHKLVWDTEPSHDCTIVGSVSEAKDALQQSISFDVVVSDDLLRDGTAFDVLGLVRDAPLILVTRAGDEETAVRAWHAGAYDYLVKDAQGDYLHALPVTIENAVAHRRARKQLELLSGALMHASDCVYITDLQGQIIFVNGAFCRTYGYPREQILGRDSSILWTGEHLCAPTGYMLGVPTAGGKAVVGFYHKRRDGQVLPISLSRAIIKDSHGQEVAIVGIVRDLSEHLLLVDEFHAEVRRLLAHDKQYKDLTTAVVETLSALLERRDVDGALRTVRDFREGLAMEKEELRMEHTDVNAGLLVTQVVETLRAMAAEKDVALVAQVSDTELVVRANWEYTLCALTWILRGLIYAVPGKVRITVAVQGADSGAIVAMESDSAVGAVRKVHQAMDGFDSFGEHSAPHGEMVLNLFVARRLIELHGGTTSIRSGRQSGEALLVTLPNASLTQKAPGAGTRQDAPA